MLVVLTVACAAAGASPSSATTVAMAAIQSLGKIEGPFRLCLTPSTRHADPAGSGS